MQSTLVLVTMTIITGLAVGYVIANRRAAHRKNRSCPENRDARSDVKMPLSDDSIPL